MEGPDCLQPGLPSCNKTGLELPLIEYGHAEGCAVIGGHVYRGTRLPELFGAYIYADFCSGRIWELRYDGANITDNAVLVDTELAISSIGTDELGELHILSYDDGSVYWLVASPTSELSATVKPFVASELSATEKIIVASELSATEKIIVALVLIASLLPAAVMWHSWRLWPFNHR